MKIYVGNLDRSVSEEEVKELFTAHGGVVSVAIIKDRYTNEPKGYGFIEMPSADEANAAIKALNGQMLKGRALTVNQAREREPRREFSGPRGGGFGGGGGSRSGGYGNRDREEHGSRGGFRGPSDRRY